MKKTMTVARKGDKARVICKHRLGYNLPPEEGPGGFIDGTGARSEAVERWQKAGWTVKREPDPNYRPPRLAFAI
jgi:hypothetical protein